MNNVWSGRWRKSADHDLLAISGKVTYNNVKIENNTEGLKKAACKKEVCCMSAENRINGRNSTTSSRRCQKNIICEKSHIIYDIMEKQPVLDRLFFHDKKIRVQAIFSRTFE